ncbi:hypothetical protein E4T54_09220 [Legionella geestiana]|nr:hypothetical protein [Legionella geestiana]QBS12907.1 hypothetical protein E4T54_09220 [Legionella geestiana]QDQ39412.1 hypothetical protein E3226_002850 [Legionella geestiana]
MPRLLIIASLGLLTLTGQAANVTQINRYATVANKPLPSQINPLLTEQQIHFPQDVKTVGQAIEWWLQYSGYSLVATEKQPDSLQAVLHQPLPQIHKNLGPLTVKDGLEVLAGQQVFELVEDPLLRVVNFKLKPSARRKA